MIHKISFENYKAFENGHLNIKPITILLGANSIGKSSIMQLILLAKQSFNYEGPYNSLLKLNGKYVNLGEPQNIFNNFNTEKPLKLKFSLSDDYEFLGEFSFLDEIRNRIRSIQKEFTFNRTFLQTRLVKKRELKSLSIKKLDKIYEDFENKNKTLVHRVKELKKNSRAYTKELDELQQQELFESRTNKKRKQLNTLIDNLNVSVLNHTEQFLKALGDLDLAKPSYEYIIGYSKKNNTLLLSSFKVYDSSGKNLIIGYTKSKSKNGKDVHKIYSDLIEDKILNKYRIQVGKKLKFHLLTPDFEDSDYSNFEIDSDLFSYAIIRLLSHLSSPLLTSFDESLISYVSPLRAYPKRYYFLDEANLGASFNTIIGENLAEILKQDRNVKKKVNNWLSGFGFEVSVDKLQDVIHHLKVNQYGLKLDITDVGFGISQILPVIVQGFLAQGHSLTLIEQPEIHLHPKMQADLADLFIDIVASNTEENKNLLIETHSEYLLRRLRRRISEKKISSEDVAIYFIKKEKKRSIIEEVKISETGAFDWPSEFYMDELDDTIAFIKNQPVKK